MNTLFGLYNKSFNVCFIVNNDSKIYFNPSFFKIELSCFNVGKTIAFDNNEFYQNVLVPSCSKLFSIIIFLFYLIFKWIYISYIIFFLSIKK